MKYIQPFGESDTNAAYDNGNRSAGIKGSVPPAAAIEFPMRELVHLIDFAGLTPANNDLQQVRKAIQALIAAATGGGDTDGYLLLTQARARLPVFPQGAGVGGGVEITITPTSPSAGTIIVPPGRSFLHRGIYPVATSDYPEIDRSFATAANKTYHCRWTYGGGFALKDVEDAGYNPGVLDEANPAFDSTYDDMLIARIVTDGANTATITALRNEDRLALTAMVEGTDGQLVGGNGASFRVQRTLNWARTPRSFMLALLKSDSSDDDNDFNIVATGSNRSVGTLTATPPSMVIDRYGLDRIVMRDGAEDLWMQFTAGA